MCGIIGTTNLSTPDKIFQLGLQEIYHRGPDNRSVTENNVVRFGHTRLSILDLDKRSNQPLQFQCNDRSILITFNGEIYNYLAVKNDLLNKGYDFKTESDTEVICAAYCEYGLDCFNYFEGMWAIAINDHDNLILSRDRVGKKPLYYHYSNNKDVHFGSSLKSVSILSDEMSIDPESIELYFALGFIPKSYTIYRNIKKIEPGYIYHFERTNDTFVLKNIQRSIFDPRFISSSDGIKGLIEQAVEKRLISDVSITTLMSGGVDSTIITSLINKLRPQTEAYFVDFTDKELSEKKWADYLAKRNHIQLNTILLNSNDLNKAFKNYYLVYEEPFADYSGIPAIAIFGEVSKKYKVVLTGDGGDELFYGYPHYYKKYLLYKTFNFLKLFRKLKFVPTTLKTILAGTKDDFEANYLKNHGILTPFAEHIINTNFNKSISESNSFLKGIIAYDRNFYNWPEKYLVKVDRSSMFSGVEVRSPFMDEDLKNTITKRSPGLFFTPFNSKLYLKIIFFKIFGFKYFTAKKRGFTPPIQELREVNFQEHDYLKLKEYLNLACPHLHIHLKELHFKDLEKDKILFDRFFFFNEWIKNQTNN
jgi:asparagine synthase (glutamine-hydrolysing)